MNIKKSILLRIRIAFLLMVIFSIAIVVKINIIQWVQGDEWREKASRVTFQFKPVKATRGNIYSDNGSLLATSLPFYRVSFDPSVPSTEVFNSSVDSLSIEIAKFFGNKTAKQYKNSLIDARKRGSRYVVISKRLLNYHEKKKVEKWPVFRLGRFKGGVIFEKVDQRFKPFEDLSDRTVGFINENNRGAGLEYSFNDQLSGTDG
ncbi:MAG: cell division protein, partial [Cyclobacteriaceae bacterium]|nr:cell division protein [Cyclobacteriaceae bacterium]